jgi:hypothetical protein
VFIDVVKVPDAASIVASSPLQAVATKARDRMRLVGRVRETMGDRLPVNRRKEGTRYSYQKVERDRSRMSLDSNCSRCRSRNSRGSPCNSFGTWKFAAEHAFRQPSKAPQLRPCGPTDQPSVQADRPAAARTRRSTAHFRPAEFRPRSRTPRSTSGRSSIREPAVRGAGAQGAHTRSPCPVCST